MPCLRALRKSMGNEVFSRQFSVKTKAISQVGYICSWRDQVLLSGDFSVEERFLASRTPFEMTGLRYSRPLTSGKFLVEALGFVVRSQAIHHWGQLSFHHISQLMQRQADAVIGHTVLRKIIGTDFFATVARLDLAAAFRAQRGLLLLQFHFIETRTEHAHGLGAIFD